MISLVIPAYNEEKRLGPSLKKLSNFLGSYVEETEVIVVDDGSKDNTVGVAKSFEKNIKNLQVIELGKNYGKGWAVKKGFEASRGEVAVLSDSDFSTPIEELPKLLTEIKNGYDIALGSRALDRSLVKKHQPLLREIIGRVSNILIRLIAVKGIYDTQCGFKAFKKVSTKEIFEKQTIKGFLFDVELLFLAQRSNLKIKEVPVLWFNDPRSSVSGVSDTLDSFLDLMRIRVRHSPSGTSLTDKTFRFVLRYETFVRFAIVGFTGTVVDYISYYFLTRFLNLSPLQANPISVELAIIWNFTFNNLWTFSRRQTNKTMFSKFLTFQFVSLGGLMLSQMQILIYTHYINIHDLIAKALTIPLVALFNYAINSKWTFRDKERDTTFSKVYPIIIIGLFVVYLLLVRRLTGNFSLFLERQ